MKKILGNPNQTNKKLIDIINKRVKNTIDGVVIIAKDEGKNIIPIIAKIINSGNIFIFEKLEFFLSFIRI